MMNSKLQRKGLLFAAIATSVALSAACGRAANDERTAGQRVDEATRVVERKAEEIKVEARQAGAEASRAVSQTAEAIGDKTRDITITAEIKTLLARDDQLKALRIDVDTVAGSVILRGPAPTPAARDRATQLAKSVTGVVRVENQLTIERG
jgi:osmotically-inducible protein OsmY